MGIIEILILVVLVISAVLLIAIVMLQDEGGDSLGGMFGGGSTTAFGSRAGNVLTKFTSVLAFVFILCVISFAYLKTPKDADSLLNVSVQEEKTISWLEAASEEEKLEDEYYEEME